MRIIDHLSDNKYVAFIDVLGFKNLVESKGEKLNTYFNIVTNVIDDIQKSDFPMESQLISDSIILATTKNKEGLHNLLSTVQTIQSKCAMQNIWLRGAITIGPIYFNSQMNIVVGKGLSDAYVLESQEKFPRVIIDPKIVIDFNNIREFYNTFNIRTNNPSRREIPLIHDYDMDMNKGISNDGIFVAFAERIFVDYNLELETLYNHIRLEMYNGQVNYSKYLWLKSYFLTTTQIMFEIEGPNNPEWWDNITFKLWGALSNL